MATINKFEDLELWQRARILCNKVYEMINAESLSRDYKLKEQMNGSSRSIMDNIAEGFDRDGNKEFRTFLSYSKGSASELKSQLYRAYDRKHIGEQEFNLIYKEVDEISKMLGGFIKYLSHTEYRGNKFKEPESYYGLKESGTE